MKNLDRRLKLIKLPSLDLDSVEVYINSFDRVLKSMNMSEKDLLVLIDKNWQDKSN